MLMLFVQKQRDPLLIGPLFELSERDGDGQQVAAQSSGEAVEKGAASAEGVVVIAAALHGELRPIPGVTQMTELVEQPMGSFHVPPHEVVGVHGWWYFVVRNIPESRHSSFGFGGSFVVWVVLVPPPPASSPQPGNKKA